MFYFSVPLGKFVRRVSRLRGGGSALPGLVVEKIDPGFMRRTLSTLPHGVAVVSGTNGKTTTTKMVVELLESQGLKVFTNRTGSNFTRGVAAALLGEVDWRGRLDADVAVLELDEAHAVHFVNQVPPRYCLLLNVLRDQLDRFGEIDKTAQLLQHIASKTTGTVVLNREDPRVARIAETAQRSRRPLLRPRRFPAEHLPERRRDAGRPRQPGAAGSPRSRTPTSCCAGWVRRTRTLSTTASRPPPR